MEETFGKLQRRPNLGKWDLGKGMWRNEAVGHCEESHKRRVPKVRACGAMKPSGIAKDQVLPNVLASWPVVISRVSEKLGKAG